MPLPLSAVPCVAILAAPGLAVLVLGCGSPGPSSAPLAGVTIGQASPDFGFVVCTGTVLHDCTGTTAYRHGARITPAVDIEPVPGCGTTAAVAARCPGTTTELATLECYARHGVLLDRFAADLPGGPTSPSRFVLRCDEGVASIDYIEPF